MGKKKQSLKAPLGNGSWAYRAEEYVNTHDSSQPLFCALHPACGGNFVAPQLTVD